MNANSKTVLTAGQFRACSVCQRPIIICRCAPSKHTNAAEAGVANGGVASDAGPLPDPAQK